MEATEGLVRGQEVVDTGSPIMVPVGPGNILFLHWISKHIFMMKIINKCFNFEFSYLKAHWAAS